MMGYHSYIIMGYLTIIIGLPHYYYYYYCYYYYYYYFYYDGMMVDNPYPQVMVSHGLIHLNVSIMVSNPYPQVSTTSSHRSPNDELAELLPKAAPRLDGR